MIRTGAQYRDSIRDGRAVFINGERVLDVTTHPMFKPIVDVRARIYDMQHEAATRDVMTSLRGRRGQCRRQQAAESAAGLVGQAARHRCRDGGDRRRRDPGRRRDGRRDVVAVRRPGRAERGRPAVLGQYPQPHRPGAARRPVPRLGQYRPQGRPVEGPAGPGPGHAAACRQGDRCRHRGAGRQIRDGRGLCQPGLHETHHRQLGQRRLFGLRGGLHLRPRLAEPEVHLPHGFRGPRSGG